MYNNRYSKFLTIVLIVIILLIIGLLVFWGIQTLNKNKIDNNSDETIAAFNNYTKTKGDNLVLPTANTTNNTVTNTVISDPYANLVIPSENENQNSGENENAGTSSDNDGEFKYDNFPMVGYIEIPKTKIKYPILKDATKEAMEKSVCVLLGNGLNKTGVTVISGHNYRNGLFFSDNAKLSTGDKIYITDNSGQTVTYEIYKKYQTTPEDASYATVDTQGKKEIVLTTCTDDSKNRIIVCAREV